MTDFRLIPTSEAILGKIVLIVAFHGEDADYAVAQWNGSCWENREFQMRYSPHYFSQWMLLPVPASPIRLLTS